MNSNRPDIIKLGNLIENYISLKDNSMAKATLHNMKIEGSDIMDTLDNLNLTTREKYETLKNEYEDLKTNYERLAKDLEQQNEYKEKLINALESILENPLIVQFTKKINNLTELIKEVK